MNSHYRAKDDLFLNITDELEVFIHSKSTKLSFDFINFYFMNDVWIC